jgi:hypothetical protein
MDTEGLCTNWQLTDTHACFANSRCGEVRNMLDNWLTMKQQLAEFETQGEHDPKCWRQPREADSRKLSAQRKSPEADTQRITPKQV